MGRTRLRWTAVLTIVGLVFVLGACSKSKKSGSKSTTTTTAAAATTTTTTAKAAPKLTLSKVTGLTDGEVVQATGSGFTPGKSINLTECSSKATGAGDCNYLPDVVRPTVKTVAADGTYGPVDFKLIKGPFGSNNIVCGSPDPCVVSLGEASADPNAERDVVDISFS